MAEEKECKICGKSFSLTPEFFYRNKSTTDGYDSYCVFCRREKNRKYIKEHPDEVSAFNKRYRRKNPRTITYHSSVKVEDKKKNATKRRCRGIIIQGNLDNRKKKRCTKTIPKGFRDRCPDCFKAGRPVGTWGK